MPTKRLEIEALEARDALSAGPDWFAAVPVVLPPAMAQQLGPRPGATQTDLYHQLVGEHTQTFGLSARLEYMLHWYPPRPTITPAIAAMIGPTTIVLGDYTAPDLGPATDPTHGVPPAPSDATLPAPAPGATAIDAQVVDVLLALAKR